MVTQKALEACGERFAKKLGKQFGKCFKDGKFKEGCWNIDVNRTYGGVVMEEVINEHGGVTHPLGSSMIPAKDFCRITRFAEDAIDISKGKK